MQSYLNHRLPMQLGILVQDRQNALCWFSVGDGNMSEPIEALVPSELHPYLNEIAERLFSGHATVMIGSGFSHNAKPQGRPYPDFPDGSQLGDLFYEKIYSKQPDADNRCFRQG